MKIVQIQAYYLNMTMFSVYSETMLGKTISSVFKMCQCSSIDHAYMAVIFL